MNFFILFAFLLKSREVLQLSSGYYVAYSCSFSSSIFKRCSEVYFYSCDIKLVFIPSTTAALVGLTVSLCLPCRTLSSAGCLTLLKMKVKETLKKNNCQWSNFFFVLKSVLEQEHSKICGFSGQLFICKLYRLLCDHFFDCLFFLSKALEIM